MSTPSTNYGWPIPTDGGDDNVWGAELVTALTGIDTDLKAVSDAGGATLLNSGVVTSAQATLDIALPSGYRHYQLYVQGLEPVTDGALLWLRASVDNGSNYLTTAAYAYAGWATLGAGTSGATAGAVAAQIVASGAFTSTAGYDSGFAADIWTDAGNNGRVKYGVNHTAQTSFDVVNIDGSGRIVTTSVLTNIRVMFSTGGISKCRWALYGVNGL